MLQINLHLTKVDLQTRSLLFFMEISAINPRNGMPRSWRGLLGHILQCAARKRLVTIPIRSTTPCRPRSVGRFTFLDRKTGAG